MDIDKYKPGQLVTSMSWRAFMELWAEMASGTIRERWPKGKVAETRKERVEDARIRAIFIIRMERPRVFEMLLQARWRSLEVYKTADGLRFQVRRIVRNG